MDMTNLSYKSYIVLFINLLIISTAILLIASTTGTRVPGPGGYLEVGIVFLIAFNGFVVYQRNKRPLRNEISHQVASYLFPLVLVGMWVYRDSFDFNILLPGVAWRSYFSLSILPHTVNLGMSE